MKPRISVVINTLNEEGNLPYALRSVKGWADEIVVVDMHSDDRTAEIARSFGAQVYLHDRVGFADPARAFAISKASGDWILILDADEMVPPTLSRVLLSIAEAGGADVVTVGKRNFLFGAEMRGSGWGPSQTRHPLFFRNGYLEATDRIHLFLHPRADARICDISHMHEAAIVHFNYVDIHQFIDKLNRYTDIEARQAFTRGERARVVRSTCRAAVGFGRRYLTRRGYRDGWRGLYVSLFMLFYRLAVAAKLKELEDTGGRETVLAMYRDEAERIVSEHEAGEGK